MLLMTTVRTVSYTHLDVYKRQSKCNEADILNMKTEEMLDLPNVSIKEIKVICAIKEAVKKQHIENIKNEKNLKK